MRCWDVNFATVSFKRPVKKFPLTSAKKKPSRRTERALKAGEIGLVAEYLFLGENPYRAELLEGLLVKLLKIAQHGIVVHQRLDVLFLEGLYIG